MSATTVLLACLAMPAFGVDRAIPAENALIVFGDSYQDDGRQYKITSDAVAAHSPGAAVAPAMGTYWDGRWSNGETLVEVAAQILRIPLLDYAIGGATSGDGNYDLWLNAIRATGLRGQIDSYENTLAKGRADPGAIYIVSASTNDYARFHDDMSANPPAVPVSAEEYAHLGAKVAQNVARAAARLLVLGARHVVLFSSYAIADSPLYKVIDPQAAEATIFARSFDVALAHEASKLRRSGASVIVFPIGDRMRDMIANPKEYGLSNVADACQATIPRHQAACSMPDRFLWWDELHPTARVHALLGAILARQAAIQR